MKNLIIFCDKTLAILVLTVGFPVSFFGCSFVNYVGINEILASNSISEIIGWIIILLISCIWLALIIFVVTPRFLSFVEINNYGIRLNIIYKKTPLIPYNKLWYFQVACYQHIFSTRHFLIMGCRALSSEELFHINLVPNSEHLVKIQLTKRNYERLRRILPPEQREKLKSLFGDTNSEKGFDIKEHFRRKELKEKKKRREKQRKTNRKIRKK